MLIQIAVKDEPILENCDILIARPDTIIQIPAKNLSEIIETLNVTTYIVDHSENMGMKSAIIVAQQAREAECDGDIQIACSDHTILSALCSVTYPKAIEGCVKVIPVNADPEPEPKPKPATRKPRTPRAKPQPEKPASQKPEIETDTPRAAEPIQDPEPDPMEDKSLVKNGEVNLESTAPDKPTDKSLETHQENAPKIMKMLKDTGIPSAQIPGCLDAIREAVSIDLMPAVVRAKLEKDGATYAMSPDETAEKLAPVFDEVKRLISEIDNARGN